MSETDDLKEQTAISKAKAQAKELGEYLGQLRYNIDVARKRSKDSTVMWHIAWVAWVVGGFFGPIINQLFTLIFICALCYDQMRFTRMMRAFGEFQGAIHVLEILGHLERTPSGDNEKKKDVFEEGVQMVKSWFAEKKEAQEKVYAPA